MPIHNFIAPLIGSSGQGGGYVIDGSGLFDGGYLSQTPSAGDSNQVFTMEIVGKHTFVPSGADDHLFTAGTNTSNYWDISWTTTGALQIVLVESGGIVDQIITTPLYRDFGAYYQIVIGVDKTAAASDDIYTIEYNGTAITSFSTNTREAAGGDTFVGKANVHVISAFVDLARNAYDYLSRFTYIDGTKLDATSFGELDDNGGWSLLNVSGLTFGTNGWLIEGGTDMAAGTDSSGNGNNFSPTGTITATNDSPTDDATNGYGNYATLNPLDPIANVTYTNGNRQQVVDSTVGRISHATIPIPEGKWVYEYSIDDTNDDNTIWGVQQQGGNQATLPGYTADSYGFYPANGKKVNNSTQSAYGTAVTTAGRKMMIAVHRNGTSLKIWAGHDEASAGTIVWQNSGDPANDTGEMFDITITADEVWFFAGGGDSNFAATFGLVNFGATDFTLDVPSGFSALNTANLPAPTVTNPSLYFNTLLYTGNGSTQSITGAGFQPDLVWMKDRDRGTQENHLADAVRGVQKKLSSNQTAAEASSANYLTSFDSDGFSVGADGTVNYSGDAFVAWCFKAGGAGSSNTDGSITSTVSVADHGGFSIATWTGTAANGTVGNGIEAADMVIIKNRTDAVDWVVGHDGLTSWAYGLGLNLTNSEMNVPVWFNSTAPGSGVFSLGTSNTVNGSGDAMVAYSFKRTPGLIGIGSYTGNGSSDGPYIVVDDSASGFRPAFVLIKNIDVSQDWVMFDNARDPYNVVDANLSPNLSNAEDAGTSLDFTANGFKPRATSDINNNSNTYIYLAFAEYPFGGDTISQARAR